MNPHASITRSPSASKAFAGGSAPTTAEELARRFRGARADRVAELLATLAMLGQARPAGDGRYAA